MTTQTIVVLSDGDTWSSIQDACVLINAEVLGTERISSGRRVSIQELIETWQAQQSQSQQMIASGK